MPRSSPVQVLTVLLSLTAALFADSRLFAADRIAPAAAQPSPQPTAAQDKLKDLGTHLRRALDIAVDLFSGNQADLLSKNKTALLSGNSPKILTDNNPKVLSENRTPILSGNTFSLFSNIKVEIHINNSGNAAAPGGSAPTIPSPEPFRNPPPKGIARSLNQ